MKNSKKERTYCELLGDTFIVVYSQAGISRFKCSKGSWGLEGDRTVYCTELNSEKCPVFGKLEEVVKKEA